MYILQPKSRIYQLLNVNDTRYENDLICISNLTDEHFETLKMSSVVTYPIILFNFDDFEFFLSKDLNIKITL